MEYEIVTPWARETRMAALQESMKDHPEWIMDSDNRWMQKTHTIPDRIPDDQSHNS